MKSKFIFKYYRSIITIVILILIADALIAQSEYQSYSFQFDQNANQYLYSTKTREHTAIKPLIIDSLIKSNNDSAIKGHRLYWNSGRFFNEHLIDNKSKNSTFYADVLPDISRGINVSGGQSTSISALGVQLGGSVSKKFSYYGSVYANNQTFPNYLSTYIHQTGIIPGQSSFADSTGNNNYSWFYVTALASYTPNKYLNITVGRDKNFIGDGYRSLLLSDYSSPYLFFKLTATLGNLRFMSMWSYMNDPASTSQYDIDRKKFGVFHYLDWNITNRLSIGLFENVIGFYTDDNGAKRPFDFYYLNPVIVMKPINNSSDDPDKSLLGFTGKYKLSSHLTYYVQFALNEFNSKDLFPNDGSYTNKYAYQLGFRGNDLFNIKGLNYLIESNNVRPFTYSARSVIENYSNNGEPLAHPWGANFREVVGFLHYQHKRWTFGLEADYGKYGLDSGSTDYGKNIFIIYTDHTKDYGNNIGQGLSTTMIYLEAKVAFILNPQYNLRLEIGALYRDDKNYQFDDKTSLFSIGLKSSFRNVYNDIVSFKTH
jgi:hypothetical protein